MTRFDFPAPAHSEAEEALRADVRSFLAAELAGSRAVERAPSWSGFDAAFSRNMKLEDTTIGWRFINPLMKAQYGVDAMPQTADNVADDYQISRADQDAFALRSQQRTAAAQAAGYFAEEIVPVRIAHKKGESVVERDEHPGPCGAYATNAIDSRYPRCEASRS